MRKRVIPKSLGLRAVDETTDYVRMRIRGSDAILPEAAEVALTDLSGGQLKNLIEFSNCREFQSESTI